MTQTTQDRDPRAVGLRVAADIALAQGTSDLVPLTLTELCAATGASTASFYREFGSLTEFRKEVAARLVKRRIRDTWDDDEQDWDNLDLSKWPGVVYAVAQEVAKKPTGGFLGWWTWMADPVMRHAVFDLYDEYGKVGRDTAVLGREHFGLNLRVDDDVGPVLLRQLRDAAGVADSVIGKVTWSDTDNVERTSTVLTILVRGFAETLLVGSDDEPFDHEDPDGGTTTESDRSNSEPANSERRERFFRAVLAEQLPHPFSYLTFWQIAANAGISASTLTQQFDDDDDLQQHIVAEVVSRLCTAASDVTLGELERVLLRSRGTPNQAASIVAAFANQAAQQLAADPSFNYFIGSAGSPDVAAIRHALHDRLTGLRSTLGPMLRLALSGTDLDPTHIDRDVFEDLVVVAIIAGATQHKLELDRDHFEVEDRGVAFELAGAALVGSLRLLHKSATPITWQGSAALPTNGQPQHSTYEKGMQAAATVAFEHGPAELVPLSVAEVCKAAKTGASSFYRVFGTAENFRTQIAADLLNLRLNAATQGRQPYLRAWSWAARTEVAELLLTHVQRAAEQRADALPLLVDEHDRAWDIDSTSLCVLLRHLKDSDAFIAGPTTTDSTLNQTVYQTVSSALLEAYADGERSSLDIRHDTSHHQSDPVLIEVNARG